ncbi:MAG: GntR family transcriptional regulator [Armatimonadota bacterium]
MGQLNFTGNCKHHILKDWLRRMIISGEYQPGDKLPSDNELAREHSISNATIRAAIASLVHEGLVYRIQGKGTYVAERKQGPIDIALVMPHLYAEVLQYKRSSPDIMPRLISAIEDEARKNNADIILYLDHGSIDKERKNLSYILDRNADAALIFYTGGMQNLDELGRVRDSGIPIVMIDRYIEGSGIDYIGTNNASGIRKAMEMLVDHGFRSIHYFEIPTFFFTSERERHDAYIDACVDLQLVPAIHTILPDSNDSDRPVDWQENVCSRYVTGIMENRSGPVAFFAENGPVQSLIWSALQSAEFNHDEIAIAVFDEPFVNMPDDIMYIEITQSLEEIGRQSVRTLISKLNGSVGKTHLVIEPEIHVTGNLNHK